MPACLKTVLIRLNFVTAISLPRAPLNSASAFIKLETNANDLAIVNVAVALTLESSGLCSQARVFAGGGTGETPVRAGSAEELLAGARVDEDVISAAAAAAQTDVDPISDHRASKGVSLGHGQGVDGEGLAQGNGQAYRHGLTAGSGDGFQIRPLLTWTR